MSTNTRQAHIYKEGNFAIVRPQSVVAIIEVKTRLRGSEFDEAIENIASVKRLVDNPEQLSGMVFGYDGTPPRPSVLNTWFKRPTAKKLAKTPRLCPTLFSFFKHGLLLLRLNYNNQCKIDDSDTYHVIFHISKIEKVDEQTNEGWQLKHILSIIYSCCYMRDFHKTCIFQEHREVQELLTFSGGIPSVDHYELDIGFVDRNKQ